MGVSSVSAPKVVDDLLDLASKPGAIERVFSDPNVFTFHFRGLFPLPFATPTSCGRVTASAAVPAPVVALRSTPDSSS
jgi:hypothetical protein